MIRSQIHIKTTVVLLACALGLIIGGAINHARAGEDPGELFNYSFAVWLGSGVYRVKDADKQFAVLRVPAAYTLRPDDLEKPGPIDRLGFRLLLPAAIGFEEETDTDFSFGAVAFVPGLEMKSSSKIAIAAVAIVLAIPVIALLAAEVILNSAAVKSQIEGVVAETLEMEFKIEGRIDNLLPN